MASEFSADLKSLDGFGALNESILDQLSPFVSTRIIRAGETIFCQGEPSPYCFGVLSGEVVIQHVTKDKRFPPKVLGVIGPGGLFGESAIFEDRPRAAMASSSQGGKLLTIRGSSLRHWIQSNPEAGQPLLLALLKTSHSRLHRTSQELSVIYGVGRLLGTRQPFLEQLSASLEFLKVSLEDLDHVVFYSRSAYWEEFSPLMAFPATPELSSIPLFHALIQEVGASGAVQSYAPGKIRAALESFKLPWESMAAIAILPLFDWDKSQDSLKGLLVLASQHNVKAFASEKHLLLSALAYPLAEALARHGRQEDTQAQSRLHQARDPGFSRTIKHLGLSDLDI